ncbi:hypothetical protein CK203_071068 [Vitis vinifera]|uniref:Uncharacterized protein n=1 Tax=Vitis vinifera TaxID=29760 RepID=A0A438E965_VITVI|nr:hypothetical protein CK203_071068 [Vitis vinifera]
MGVEGLQCCEIPEGEEELSKGLGYEALFKGHNALCKETTWRAMGAMSWLGQHQKGDLDARYVAHRLVHGESWVQCHDMTSCCTKKRAWARHEAAAVTKWMQEHVAST